MITGDLVCRGSFVLGTACGCCARCRAELPKVPGIIREIRDRQSKAVHPTQDEWQWLWEYHQTAETIAASAKDYDGAKMHRDRAAEIGRCIGGQCGGSFP